MFFYKNGIKKEEGFYLNGLKNGYFKYYREAGSLKNIKKYKKGKEETNKEKLDIKIKKTFYNNAKIKTKGSYINNIPDGIHRKYN